MCKSRDDAYSVGQQSSSIKNGLKLQAFFVIEKVNINYENYLSCEPSLNTSYQCEFITRTNKF